MCAKSIFGQECLVEISLCKTFRKFKDSEIFVEIIFFFELSKKLELEQRFNIAQQQLYYTSVTLTLRSNSLIRRDPPFNTLIVKHAIINQGCVQDRNGQSSG